MLEQFLLELLIQIAIFKIATHDLQISFIIKYTTAKSSKFISTTQ